MKELVLEFLGIDDWSRPVYKTEDGEIFKDINCDSNVLHLCTACGFYGEPDTSIENIPKYAGMKIKITGRENEPTKEEKFRYMMLSRLQSDCNYYLGNGDRNPKNLWAGDEQDQITEMKRLYNNFSDDKKPEWLTWEQILDYENQMVR